MKKMDGGISRRGFLRIAALSGGALWAGKRMFAQTASGSGLAKFVTREPGRLRMLAFTDLHFFAGQNKERVNKRTLAGLKAMLKAFNPELFLVNGDTWFEGGPLADEHSQATIEMLSSLGVPWVLVLGNHDVMNDSEKTYRLLSSAPNSLFRGGGSQGDYRVEILSPGADRPFWNLIIVNDCEAERGFGKKQIEWFNAEASRIRAETPAPPPAFVFAHIPIPEQDLIWKEGKAKGVKGEKYLDEGSLPEAFAAFKSAGFVKAFFAGHNHLDDYYGELDGIRLQFLRASGHGGYGGLTLKKGGTLITIDTSRPEPQFEAVTVFPNGKTWKQ
jgi:hypothetical protein